MSGGVKIITFDIPEREKQKRKWLRKVLLHLDFSMLQKSVWVGKCLIPEEFISHLRQQEMMDYVQIFEISKSGTITKFG